MTTSLIAIISDAFLQSFRGIPNNQEIGIRIYDKHILSHFYEKQASHIVFEETKEETKEEPNENQYVSPFERVYECFVEECCKIKIQKDNSKELIDELILFITEMRKIEADKLV